MADEILKILRLVERDAISKEQGYILIKAHYEKGAAESFAIGNFDDAKLCDEEEAAIENTAELIEEYLTALSEEAQKAERQDIDFSATLDRMVRDVMSDVRGLTDNASEANITEENAEESPADNNNFIKKDFYLAGEKVYDQRNVSIKSIKRGKKYRKDFHVYEIADCGGENIPDGYLRRVVMELISEKFCGRYRKIRNGNVIKIFIE